MSRTTCSILVVALSLAAATLGAPVVGAQGTAPATVTIRESAAALARAGAANGDARSVLAAAQLLITAERASPGVERVVPAPDPVRPEEQEKAGVFTAAGLLRLASRIAVEQRDATTARLAAELAANRDVGIGDAALGSELRTAAQALTQTRGAAGGPIWADGFVAANETAEFKLNFQGGYVPNKIDVSASNPNADLDCYLYEGGNLVTRDNGYGGSCSIKWTQKVGGAMTLRVRNVGTGTYYVLISN